jgi:hypothetical protein
MRHLSNEELLVLAEDGSPDTSRHMEGCAICRARVEALRETFVSMREDEVPEPSPLFWAHFSKRVSQAIAAESRRAPARQGWLGRWRPMAAAGALAAAVLVVFLIRTQAPPSSNEPAARTGALVASRGANLAEPTASSATTGSDAAVNAAPEAGDATSADASWTLMTELAADLDLDSANEAGLVIRPGSAERAVGQLSEEERQSFAEFLREELSRPAL